MLQEKKKEVCGMRMKQYFLTWAIEDSHGVTTFYSEAVKCNDWESHVASTIRRQQKDGSGRYVAPWRLVFMTELSSSQVVDALEECSG